MNGTKLFAILMTLCLLFTSSAAVGSSGSGTIYQSGNLDSRGSVDSKTLARFDGKRVTQKFVKKFARGTLLTWGLCNDLARANGDCVFYWVEERSLGAQLTYFMSERTCDDSSAPNCRKGYLATMRSRATFQYNSADDSARFTQRVYQSTALALFDSNDEGNAPAERLFGTVEGTLTPNSYDLVAYDANGDFFDNLGASISAVQGEFVDDCTVLWEAGLAGAGVLGGMVGSLTASAAALATADLFLAMAGTGTTWAGAAAFGLGGFVATPIFMGSVIGLATAAVTIGAVSVAINHWCQSDSPNPPNAPNAPSFPDGFIPSPSNTCGEDYVYTEYCWDCSYDTVTYGSSFEGYEEAIAEHVEQECCQWGCLPFDLL